MISRRDLLELSSLVGLAPSFSAFAFAQDLAPPDYKIDIAPLTLDSFAPARNSAPISIRGIIKDVVLIDSQTQAEVEFTANNPGATLFHCHQQSHMDLGFMLLFDYA